MLLFPPRDELAPLTSLDEAERNLKLWKESAGDRNTQAHVALKTSVPPEARDEPLASTLFGSTSGLSRAHVTKATNMALQAVVLGYHRRSEMHYTEGGTRWEGIDSDRKAWRGEVPFQEDCSSFYTWGVWNGLDHFHVRDVVNGQRWRAGFTGTMLEHGRHVRSPFPGCAIIYDGHTAMYTGGGLVVSFGSEIGPLLLPWRYRTDIVAIRSYIA